MSAPGVPLTAINGGMTRLRVKGAARKDSLYLLKNGFVTVGNTVKVRPGTYRNVNLADTTGAGTTKGLVAYKGSRHVFSDHEVSVPEDYTLHVLNHPGATQPVTGPVTQTTTAFGGGSSSGALPHATSNGFSLAVAGSGNTFANNGSIISGPPAVGLYTINALSYANNLYPFINLTAGFVLAIEGTVAQNYITSVSWTDAGGAHTLATSGATWDNSTYAGFTYWVWPMATSNLVGINTAFTIIAPAATSIVPIPLKEIHFAAPFMGFLYVAAEFDVTDPTVLAQEGSVFHYWIQTSGTWAPDTVYQIGQIISPTVPNGFTYRATRISSPYPVWTPRTLMTTGDTAHPGASIVEPTVPNGYYFTVTSTDGANPLTGSVEPTWPTAMDATVAEDSEATGQDQVATPAPQPSINTPSPGTGSKYTNPYTGPVF